MTFGLHSPSPLHSIYPRPFCSISRNPSPLRGDQSKQGCPYQRLCAQKCNTRLIWVQTTECTLSTVLLYYCCIRCLETVANEVTAGGGGKLGHSFTYGVCRYVPPTCRILCKNTSLLPQGTKHCLSLSTLLHTA